MPLILPNTIANSIPADGDKLDQNFDTIVDWANQNAITADGSTAMIAPLLLPGAPTQPDQAATKSYVDTSVPVGVMWQFAGDVAPTNWMMCQGQAISRATYVLLFTAIGTRFGVGDNSSTFNLPDMRGRCVFGVDAAGGALSGGVGEKFGSKDAALPAHDHGGAGHIHGISFMSGPMDRSPNHSHWLRGAGDTTQPGGFGEGNVADVSNTNFDPQFNTNDVGVDHLHAINGATEGNTASNTAGAGVDGTNLNLPPLVTLHFIMKVS